MAVQTTMTNNYTKAADAIAQSKSSKNSGAVGYTDRGTAIVNSNTELGKNAFLNILVAELSNMDPTQDQDSTAYVTQMAEFASIEQLNNLNSTMRDFAHQQMVGQVGILSEKDTEGNSKFGIITQVFKNGTTTYATIQDATTGEYKNYEISKVIGTSDSGYNSSIYETALNSNYQSALLLAQTEADTIIVDKVTTKTECLDEDKNVLIKTTTTTLPIKGKITGAYLDKASSAVMITVTTTDSEGNETVKDYDYSSIAIAGKLSEELLKETYDKYKDSVSTVVYTNKLTGEVIDNPKLAETESSNAGDNDTTEVGSSSPEDDKTNESSSSETNKNEETNSTVTKQENKNINNEYSKEDLYNATIASENEILSRIMES